MPYIYKITNEINCNKKRKVAYGYKWEYLS